MLPFCVCSPLITILEVAVVLKVTFCPLVGVKVEDPLALNSCPEVTVAPALKVASPNASRVEERVVTPLTPKVPPIVVFPVEARILNLSVLTLKSPVRFRVPPKLASPVPTVKVLAPVTEVAPFRDTFPVPVPKVPDPV